MSQLPTLLITGRGGFLGCRAADWFARCGRYRVIPVSHAQLDITDCAAVAEAFARIRPNYVLHCAAISDTGASERAPERSKAVNLRGVENVALASAAVGAKLVWMSSDQVYNGTLQSGPLPEYAPLSPENVYGRHKLQAEHAAAAACPSAVALRLTWMYDLPGAPYALNRGLPVNLAASAAAGKAVSAAVRETRGITDVWAVIERLEACFALPGGVYNFGCENTLSSFETFRRAAALMGLPDTLVQPDEARYAAHPRNLAMDTAKACAAGIVFPDTLEGLREVLRRRR